jgi:hypothetical protein
MLYYAFKMTIQGHSRFMTHSNPTDDRFDSPQTIRRPFWFWLWFVPYAIFIRIYVTVVRRRIGHPLRKYSEVTSQLWVGGQHRAKGWGWMQEQGITAIVDLRKEFDDAAAGIAPEHYLYLPTIDNTPPSIEDLERGVEFIRQEIERGGIVYIHCGVGVGRAPTMAACYLTSTGLSPAVAWATIRAVRPFVLPRRSQAAMVLHFKQE